MNQVLHLPANVFGRDFVVGDIHGCYVDLVALLAEVGFDPLRDRVIATGDLGDRGPASASVFLLLETSWFYSVRGNHEQMLLEAQEDVRAMRHWFENGGGWWLGEDAMTRATIVALAGALPLAIVVGAESGRRFNVLHAEFFGSDGELGRGDFGPETAMRMLWGRDLASGRVLGALPESPTFVGHTIAPEVTQVGSVRFMDGGAYLGHWHEPPVCGRLALCEVKTGRVWTSAPDSCMPPMWRFRFPGLYAALDEARAA